MDVDKYFQDVADFADLCLESDEFKPHLAVYRQGTFDAQFEFIDIDEKTALLYLERRGRWCWPIMKVEYLPDFKRIRLYDSSYSPAIRSRIVDKNRKMWDDMYERAKANDWVLEV